MVWGLNGLESEIWDEEASKSSGCEGFRVVGVQGLGLQDVKLSVGVQGLGLGMVWGWGNRRFRAWT